MCNSIPHSKTRRTILKGIGVGALASIQSFNTAEAQYFRTLCSYSGGFNGGSGLSQPSQLALSQVRQIEQALGYFANLDVYRGGVPNASATVIQNRYAIVYNPQFLSELAQCHPAAALTVLAHEVGHHANADITWAGQFKHSYNRELGADFISGVAMRRLGHNLSLAQSGILCSFGPFSPGSPSHPDSQQRLAAITDGWRSA